MADKIHRKSGFRKKMIDPIVASWHRFTYQRNAYGAMPTHVWLTVAVVDGISKFFLFLWNLLVTVIISFLNIFIYTYKGIVFTGKFIGHLAVRYYRTLRDGNWKTRLSFLVMGSGAFLNGQIIKGLFYLAIQVGFVLFMVFYGGYYIHMLGTLGTTPTISGFYCDQTYHDLYGCEIGTYGNSITGDNSMLILLFGVATLILVVGFIIFYGMNINLAITNEKLIKEGKKPASFRKDIASFLDEKFHITVLSFPILAAFSFTVLPLVFMILVAFTNYDGNHQPPGVLFTWVGLENFINLFSGTNPQMAQLPGTLGRILGWTLIWAFFATFLNYIFGMILALMINKKGIKLKKLWRTIFVITIAVPQFISLLCIRLILSDSGPIHELLVNWGWIQQSFSFLGKSPLTARITVIVVNLWVGMPYTMLITSGILMNIPEDLYESARIDGANAFVQFFKITLPYMFFVTGPYLVTQFIGNINNFNVIYFLTGGGPSSLSYYQAGTTDLLVTWLYKLTQFNQQYAMSSALGIIIFVVCAFFSLIMYSRTGAVQKEEEFQ